MNELVSAATWGACSIYRPTSVSRLPVCKACRRGTGMIFSIAYCLGALVTARRCHKSRWTDSSRTTLKLGSWYGSDTRCERDKDEVSYSIEASQQSVRTYHFTHCSRLIDKLGLSWPDPIRKHPTPRPLRPIGLPWVGISKRRERDNLHDFIFSR